jgi:hypothetical protein
MTLIYLTYLIDHTATTANNHREIEALRRDEIVRVNCLIR